MRVDPNTILKQGGGILKEVHLFICAFSKFNPNKVSKQFQILLWDHWLHFQDPPPE